MSLKERIDQDLKQAMLAGDKSLVSTLRGLKSAVLYAEVAKGVRDSGGLSDPEVVEILSKESKKRQESADLYRQGGDEARAASELAEKTAIDDYLPEQMDEEQLMALISDIIQQTGATGVSSMGQIISQAKQSTAGQADGATIARLVKERLAA